MVSLMLDPRFKTLHLVSSLIGHEQGKAILKNMTKNSYALYVKCFINCIHWLNLKGVLLSKGLKRTRVWIFLK